MDISIAEQNLSWLLEPENPSVRYWTLVDLLERPADDPQVVETRRLIQAMPMVVELLSKQQAGGYWGEDETKPTKADGTGGVLSMLCLLGASLDAQTTMGCESFLRNAQNECGGISMVKRQRSGIFPCITGSNLNFLVYFGYGDDPRLRKAFAFLIEAALGADPLDCGRYNHRACLWGAIAALDGLAVLPVEMRSAESGEAVRRMAEALLSAKYDFEGEHKRWLTSGVPRTWNLGTSLLALARHEYAGDPRFEPLLERFMGCRDEQGRWLCGSVSRTWPLEKRNRPSKWVTLDGLRLMKAAGRKEITNKEI